MNELPEVASNAHIIANTLSEDECREIDYMGFTKNITANLRMLFAFLARETHRCTPRSATIGPHHRTRSPVLVIPNTGTGTMRYLWYPQTPS